MRCKSGLYVRTKSFRWQLHRDWCIGLNCFWPESNWNVRTEIRTTKEENAYRNVFSKRTKTSYSCPGRNAIHILPSKKRTVPKNEFGKRSSTEFSFSIESRRCIRYFFRALYVLPTLSFSTFVRERCFTYCSRTAAAVPNTKLIPNNLTSTGNFGQRRRAVTILAFGPERTCIF